jgi:glucose-1-phosphate cytidylyltransferase
MKAVILAGGFGTRIFEESRSRPKPMVEIGGRPILWHIMKYFSEFGINDFVVLGGYKVEMIRKYFLEYKLLNSDFTISYENEDVKLLSKCKENWKVTVINSGLDTMTGGRLLSAKSILENEEDFFFTYGDGLSNINLTAQLDYHRKHGKLATLAAVRPPERFGRLSIESDGLVGNFKEKPYNIDSYVNGGFFILKPQVIDLIENSQTTWEREPLQNLSSCRQLMAYKHEGFWRPMDTLKDKNDLESMWNSDPKWKIW